MRRQLVTLGFAAMMMGAISAPARADVVYAVNGIDTFAALALTVASVTDGSVISTTTITGLPSGTNGFNGLAFNPTNNMLYASVSGALANGYELVEIDPASAVSTTIGPINGGTGIFDGLAFNSAGELYSIERRHPSIPPTHPPTEIPATIVQIGILATDGGNILSSQDLSTNTQPEYTLAGSNIPGTFYGVENGGLETINQTYGTVTPGPGLSLPPFFLMNSMSYYGTTLYGLAVGSGQFSEAEFGSVDPATGAFNVVSTGTIFGSDPIAVGAAVSVPEPASIALLVGGVLGLGLWRWKTAGASKQSAI
jgi:hypothetical protein